jgi:hypothetical protein
LRYYDTDNDTVIKGVIDLSDVEAINQGLPSSYMQQIQQQQQQQQLQYSTTKKALNSIGVNNLPFSETNSNESNKCFELKTSKRVYYFCAKTPHDAYKWVKQLETCCLDS